MILRVVTGFLALALLLVGAAAVMSPGFRADFARIAEDTGSRFPVLGQETTPWDNAIELSDGSRLGVVTANVVNVRTGPSLDAQAIDSAFEKHLVRVYESVDGDEVDGEETWYRVGNGQYLTAAWVEPFQPREPEEFQSGHWVHVDLTDHYAVAYDGESPVYAAILMTGRAGWDTPEGNHQVLARVESETMDASTIGIPEDAPNYYYLENVPYVQYFAPGGYAIHGNDWSPPEAFGDTGSHGCINMKVEDAEYFWEFLEMGSSVVITQ